jgi:predicted MFS family arabinose efflux permease
MLKRPEVILSYLSISLAMLGAFMLIPNFSAYFQKNLSFPRERLGLLYLVGGSISFIAMRFAGRLVDVYSAFAVICGSTLLLAFVLLSGYVFYPPLIPSLAIFTGFMVAMSIRGVSVGSLNSRVPLPEERAGFMSFQSAIQHMSCASGAIFSTSMLSEGENGALIGMPKLALICLGLALVIPFTVFQLETRVRRKEAIAPEPSAFSALPE